MLSFEDVAVLNQLSPLLALPCIERSRQGAQSLTAGIREKQRQGGSPRKQSSGKNFTTNFQPEKGINWSLGANYARNMEWVEKGLTAADATVRYSLTVCSPHRFDSVSRDTYATLACSSHTSRRSLSRAVSSCALFKETLNFFISSAVQFPSLSAPPLLLP